KPAKSAVDTTRRARNAQPTPARAAPDHTTARARTARRGVRGSARALRVRHVSAWAGSRAVARAAWRINTGCAAHGRWQIANLSTARVADVWRDIGALTADRADEGSDR